MTDPWYSHTVSNFDSLTCSCCVDWSSWYWQGERGCLIVWEEKSDTIPHVHEQLRIHTTSVDKHGLGLGNAISELWILMMEWRWTKSEKEISGLPMCCTPTLNMHATSSDLKSLQPPMGCRPCSVYFFSFSLLVLVLSWCVAMDDLSDRIDQTDWRDPAANLHQQYNFFLWRPTKSLHKPNQINDLSRSSWHV